MRNETSSVENLTYSQGSCKLFIQLLTLFIKIGSKPYYHSTEVGNILFCDVFCSKELNF